MLQRCNLALGTDQSSGRAIEPDQEQPASGSKILSARGAAVKTPAVGTGSRWPDPKAFRDLAGRTVTIRKSLSRTEGLKDPKTKAGFRTVPLSPPAYQALADLHCSNDGRNVGANDRVILTFIGKPMDSSAIYADHRRIILEIAGLVAKGEPTPYRFHSLRHTAVSLLIEQKLSPFHIKSVIGHASVTTTLDVYGHMFPADDSIAKAASAAAASLALDATHTRLEPLTL